MSNEQNSESAAKPQDLTVQPEQEENSPTTPPAIYENVQTGEETRTQGSQPDNPEVLYVNSSEILKQQIAAREYVGDDNRTVSIQVPSSPGAESDKLSASKESENDGIHVKIGVDSNSLLEITDGVDDKSNNNNSSNNSGNNDNKGNNRNNNDDGDNNSSSCNSNNDNENNNYNNNNDNNISSSSANNNSKRSKIVAPNEFTQMADPCNQKTEEVPDSICGWPERPEMQESVSDVVESSNVEKKVKVLCEPAEQLIQNGEQDTSGNGNDDGPSELVEVNAENEDSLPKTKYPEFSKEAGTNLQDKGDSTKDLDTAKTRNCDDEKERNAETVGDLSSTGTDLTNPQTQEKDRSTSSVSNTALPKTQEAAVVDLFSKNSDSEKMTVVFHAILAPNFKYDRENGDKIFLRCRHEQFGGLLHNVVELFPQRKLDDGYIQIQGTFRIPVSVLPEQLAYSYLVWKKDKASSKSVYYWEKLLGSGPHTKRCLEIPREYRKPGATRPQFDDTVYNEPKGLQTVIKTKTTDPAEGRKIATLAAFPRWEGFSTTEGCVSMTAWEAVQHCNVVASSMTTSKAMEHDGTTVENTPSGYDFGKVLKKFLKLRLTANVTTEAEGRDGKILDDDPYEKQLLRLSSSLAIATLLSRHSIMYLEKSDLRNIFLSLNLHYQVGAQRCQLYEGLVTHFPEESWLEVGESLQKICNHTAVIAPDVLEWLLAVPLVHFLLGYSDPFEPVPQRLVEQEDEGWWGTKGFLSQMIRNRYTSSKSYPPKFLSKLCALFELDPLFRRTFLRFVPVQAFPNIAASLKQFTPLEVLTLVERTICDQLSPEQWDAIERCVQAVLLDCKHKQFADKKEKEDIACVSQMGLRLLVLVGQYSKFNRITLVCDCLRVLTELISILCRMNQEKEKLDGIKRPFEETLHGRFTMAIIKLILQQLKENTPDNFCRSNGKSLDKELTIWSHLLSVPWNSKECGQVYLDTLQQTFKSGQLEQMYIEDLVELVSTVDLSKYCAVLRESVFTTVFRKIKEISMQHGSEKNKIFQVIVQHGLKSPHASQCVEMLALMLRLSWPRKSDHSLSFFTLDVLKYVLEWGLWPGYLEVFGRGTKCYNMLNEEGQKMINAAVDAVTATVEMLQKGTISVHVVEFIQMQGKRFERVCGLIETQKRRNVISLGNILQKRWEDFMIFQGEQVKLHSFIKFCSMIMPSNQTSMGPAVDLGSLPEKVKEDVSNCPISSLGQYIDEIEPDIKDMIDALFEVRHSQLFQKFWKLFLAKALETPREKQQLSLQELHSNVWKRAYEKVTRLRDEFLEGRISLKVVDRHFERFEGHYDELEREMIQLCGIQREREKTLLRNSIAHLQQYHSLQRCNDAACAIWNVKMTLELKGDFRAVKHLRNQMTDEFKKYELRTVDEKLIEAGRKLSTFTYKMINTLEAVSKCNELITWLRQTIKNLQELKVLVDLAMISAGETAMEIDRIMCLHASGVAFAPLIFEVKKQCGFDELMEKCKPVWEALESDPLLPKKLVDTNREIEWLKEVKQSHGSVATSSLLQAEAINARGIFRVGCLPEDTPSQPGKFHTPTKKTLDSVIHLTVPPKREHAGKTQVYSLDGLKDLQSKLMLIAGKAAQGKAREVEIFVEAMNGILRLATVYIELCEAGNTEYLNWNATFERRSVTHTSEILIARLREQAEKMEEHLKEWQNEIHSKRKNYSKLNHFTAQQLLVLRRNLARVRRSNVMPAERLPTSEVYSLLECVLPGIKPSTLIDALVQAENLTDKEGRHLKKSYKSSGKSKKLHLRSDKQYTSTARSFGAGCSVSTPSPAAEKSAVHPSSILKTVPSAHTRGPPSTITLEEFKSLVNKVEESGYSEETALAAVVSCGDAKQAALIVWCLEHGMETGLVAKLYSQAVKNPRYARLVGEETPNVVDFEETNNDEREETGIGTSVKEEKPEDIEILEDSSTIEEARAFPENKSGVDDEDYLSLDELGTVLSHMATTDFKRQKRNSGILGYLKLGTPNPMLVPQGLKKEARRFPNYLKCGKPNLIIVPQDDILSTVLALYMHDSRQPLPNVGEVLICTRETTSEEIELLWRRALDDSENRLYCVINADHLDFSVSQKAVNFLKLLMHEFGEERNKDFGLVIISSSENEGRAHVVTALEQYRVNPHAKLPTHDQIEKYLAKKFKSVGYQQGKFCQRKLTWVPAAEVDQDRLSVRIVNSNRSGCGKSRVVQRLHDRLTEIESNKTVATELEKETCITIPIHGTKVNESAVVEHLLPFTVNSDLPMSRIFHLDISPSVRNGLDTLLFNLLILGTLKDAYGRVWRKRPCDLYIIEMTKSLDFHPGLPSRTVEAETSKASGVSGTSSTAKASSISSLCEFLPAFQCHTPSKTLSLLKEHQERQQAAKNRKIQVDPSINLLVDNREFRSPAFQRVYLYLSHWSKGKSLDQLHFEEYDLEESAVLVDDHVECLETVLS